MQDVIQCRTIGTNNNETSETTLMSRECYNKVNNVLWIEFTRWRFSWRDRRWLVKLIAQPLNFAFKTAREHFSILGIHECRITLTSVPFASSPQLLAPLDVLQAEGCFLQFAIDTIISQTSNRRLKKNRTITSMACLRLWTCTSYDLLSSSNFAH